MEGWIKLHRKLNETSFKSKPLIMALFVDLLTNANHKKHSFIFNKKEVFIEAGSLVTGRKELSKRTGISQQSIRTALATLKSTNTITIEVTTKYSVITICNWSKYQLSTNKLTNKQPTSNQQATTYKNDKNDKNDKKERLKSFFTKKKDFEYDPKTQTYKLKKQV